MSPIVLFKALADDTRLSILLLVFQHKELCVCELTTALQVSQPKISRHLALLKQQHILADEKRGQWVYYRLHDDLPEWCRDIIQHTHEYNQDYLHPLEQALQAMGDDRPLNQPNCL